MEPVDVLRRVQRLDRLRLVEMLRQRRLDEDAVDRVVVVQLLDDRDQLLLRDVCREPPVVRADSHPLRRLVLAADVDVRRGIVADEHGREADVAQPGDVAGDLGLHFRGEGAAVHDRRRHRATLSGQLRELRPNLPGHDVGCPRPEGRRPQELIGKPSILQAGLCRGVSSGAVSARSPTSSSCGDSRQPQPVP